MAGRGDYYPGIDPNAAQFQRPRNQLGALANLRGERRMQEGEENPRMADAMRPQQSPEEYAQKVTENKRWLQDPKTQAAMMAFAVNIMQPLGDGAGAGEFIGALGRSIGAGAQAAYGIEEQEMAQAAAEREALKEERDFQLRERGQDFQESKFQAEQDFNRRKAGSEALQAGQRIAIDRMRLNLDERKFLREGEQAFEQTKVISWNDPLNEQLQLGIPKGSSAKVKIKTNSQGEPFAGSVEGEYSKEKEPEGLGGDAKEISDLYTAADQWESQAGLEVDPAKKAELQQRAKVARNRAYQISQEFSLGTGEMLEAPSAPTGVGVEADAGVAGARGTEATATGSASPQVVPIPGGKLAREREAAEQAKQAGLQQQRQEFATIAQAVTNIRSTIQNSMAPNYLITGGIGSLLSALPVGTDSRMVSGNLNTIKAKIGFDQLQAMREASPTGGALGTISDKENELLQSILGNLDQFQGDATQLQEELLKIQWLFDPEAINKRQELQALVNDKKLDENEAMGEYFRMLDEYIYPPELQRIPPFDMTLPPEYVTPDAKELWNDLEPREKLYFLSPDDYNRAIRRGK